ncbi:MAG: hypothetical protein J7K84_07295 [Deltaproteobacteria bacterium]|nr:hypothetical protein [Deltaproteobacteria bacterium]
MYLLIVVINNEEILDDLLTGWLDMGITGATIVESTDSLQLISHHIPIFAGFRTLTSGGTLHNKTLFTAIENMKILDKAVDYLETLCSDTGMSSQGIYFVLPLVRFKRLGHDLDHFERQRHLEKKLGRPLKADKKLKSKKEESG